MKGQQRIDQCFAFIVLDDDGTEGVPAFYEPTLGVLLPMMGADLARVENLRPLAESDPGLRGKRITIAKFSHRETIGVIDRTQER
jgi:hypothetical protein